MSVPEPEVVSLDAGCGDGPLRVGLLEGEPAGVISTRNAGCAEFEAALEWPPGWETPTGVVSQLPELPDVEGAGVRGSLYEARGPELTTVRGTLFCTEEEALCSALDRTLRAAASTAAVREASLRTRVSRAGKVSRPAPGAVQLLAGRLWRSRMRVGFGVSWSPAVAGADVMVGCRGMREDLVRALSESAPRVDRIGAAG